MAVGDRFKKFDLEKLRTYEKYDNEGTLKINAQNLIPDAVKTINNSVEEKMKLIVMEKAESIPVWFEYTKEKQKELIENLFEVRLKAEFGLEDISGVEKESIIDKIVCHVSGFGILQTYLEQSNVDAVIVNSTNSVMIQMGGKIVDTEMSLDKTQLEFLIKSIQAKSPVKLTDNINHIKFENYSISVINLPVASSGVIIRIKKNKQALGLNDLILSKFLTKELADFIMTLINAKEKIIISGDILSGKTTLIDNILASLLHSSRVALIEDTTQISTNYSRHLKFSISDLDKNGDIGNLLSMVFSMLPEYAIFDSKNSEGLAEFIENIPENMGVIVTECASSSESAISKLISAQNIYSHVSEKLAKQKILSEFNYIIHLDKDNKGNCRIRSIHEINITRNSAQVLKELYNAETSLKINSDEDIDGVLIADEKSSIKSRFNFS